MLWMHKPLNQAVQSAVHKTKQLRKTNSELSEVKLIPGDECGHAGVMSYAPVSCAAKVLLQLVENVPTSVLVHMS
jgi:hypothetical protein